MLVKFITSVLRTAAHERFAYLEVQNSGRTRFSMHAHGSQHDPQHIEWRFEAQGLTQKAAWGKRARDRDTRQKSVVSRFPTRIDENRLCEMPCSQS